MCVWDAYSLNLKKGCVWDAYSLHLKKGCVWDAYSLHLKKGCVWDAYSLHLKKGVSGMLIHCILKKGGVSGMLIHCILTCQHTMHAVIFIDNTCVWVCCHATRSVYISAIPILKIGNSA